MAQLNVDTLKLRKIAVVTLTGDFVQRSSLGLRDTIIPLIEEGFRCFVIEFDVSQMDEAGLGEFVSAFTTITNLGGELAIVRNELFRNVMRKCASYAHLTTTLLSKKRSLRWKRFVLSEKAEGDALSGKAYDEINNL